MSIDSLSLTFAAIADPTRRAILTRLSKGDAPVKELAKPFQMTLPAVSKHLKVLERAGLIERTRAAQTRPCKLRAKPLKQAASWIDRYRAFVTEPGKPDPKADPKIKVAVFDGDASSVSELDALIAYLQMLGTLVDFAKYDESGPNLR